MISSARNPKWTNSDKSSISVEILFNGEWMSFVASPNDCTEHGPLIFALAEGGAFGEVEDSDYEKILRGDMPPPEGYIVKDGELINFAKLELEANNELNRRLAALNSEETKARAELDEEYAEERKQKLAALLAVKEQEGWPFDIEWPKEQ